ncbi:MAG TPA: L,D-transpeptidase family protein [Actinomycetota bacterium]|nr:L,D-transpeptidase family protein [Actinomycetota bacterium]
MSDMSDKQSEQVEEVEVPMAAPSTEVISSPSRLARMRHAFFRRPSAAAVRWMSATIFVLVTVSSAGVAYATYDYSSQYSGLILPGTWVAGVDLGGMTETEATTAVADAIQPHLTRTITLRWRGQTWEVTPKQLGARNNAADAVAAAVQASREAGFLDKARLRVLGTTTWFDEPLAIRYPKRALRSFLQGLASGFNRPARDATIDYSTGWVKVIPELAGRKMHTKETFNRLQDALDAGETEAVIAANWKRPKVLEAKYDQILLLRIGENKLYLYEDGKITHRWVVAPGQPYYPTPTGEFEITEKRYMPTWVNPAPDGWGADMPASIPPGISNPLGLRALNWSAPAIRFHGTTATYSLGYNASHGCVRMANEDVIELYDLVDVGTPIISTVVAPLRPMYSSAPDPVVVESTEPSEDSANDEAEEREPARPKKDN